MTDELQEKPAGLCELLPWYVNGTLTEAESLAEEEHLQHCHTCAQELPVLREVQASLKRESVAVLAPKPHAGAFLARVELHTAPPIRYRRALLGSAIAAAVALLAAVLYWTGTGPSANVPVVYQTATAGNSGGTFDYVLQISVDPGVGAREQSDALQALEAESITGPDSAGHYRVVIRLPARSLAELEAFTRHIETAPAIASAAVIAVELPVETH